MQLCDLGCGRPATVYSKHSKRWRCERNRNKCPGKRERDSQRKKGKNPWEGREHPRGARGKSPFNKGKTYEELFGLEKATELKAAHSNRSIGKSFWDKMSLEAQEEFRRTHREKINQRYAAGWMPKAGRCKKIRYESPIAGSVLLDGTWELKVAKWLDIQKFQWERNKKRFEYTKPDGRTGFYTPDFYVHKWGCFLEVKGYETELDRCKWSQFREPLTIWRRQHINSLNTEG